VSVAILRWLGGHDTGLSSKAIALTALGEMPARAAYPGDSNDFGRCYRLLLAAPKARAGLDKLAADGGPYWEALAERWADIEAAYIAETAGGKSGATYELMRAILDPIEAKDRSIVRLGNGVSMRFGA
jgi:hypothetical protein